MTSKRSKLKRNHKPQASGFIAEFLTLLFFCNYIGSFWRPFPLKFLGKSRARKKEKEWRTYHFISKVCTLIYHAARNHSDIVKIKIWSNIYKLCVNNLASGKLGDGIQGKERITCQRSRFCLASPADILRRAFVGEGTRDARLRMSAGEARFCLVPRRLSLDVNLNFREVPACASSLVTCVSCSPLFKTKD